MAIYGHFGVLVLAGWISLVCGKSIIEQELGDALQQISLKGKYDIHDPIRHFSIKSFILILNVAVNVFVIISIYFSQKNDPLPQDPTVLPKRRVGV